MKDWSGKPVLTDLHHMLIRPMRPEDIPAAHVIRLRVQENQLSDPSVVAEQDYHAFMARDTMSWVCEVDG